MTTTPRVPIWKDPMARMMGCSGAAVVSWILLVEFVTIPYLFIPASLVMNDVIMFIVGSPDRFIEMLLAGPGGVGIVAFAIGLSMATLILFVPLVVTVAVPFAVSYWFWMEVVYDRVLGERQEPKESESV